PQIMKYQFLRSLQLRLFILDTLVINIVFFSLQFLFQKYTHAPMNAEYMYFIFSINVIWVVIGWLKHIYDERLLASFEDFAKASLKAYVYLLLAVIILLFF